MLTSAANVVVPARLRCLKEKKFSKKNRIGLELEVGLQTRQIKVVVVAISYTDFSK